MKNLVNDLKKYFEENTDEQILKDWIEVEENDKVGPTIDEFLSNMAYFPTKILEPQECFNNFINENLSPKFTSGFFITQKLN